MVAECSTLGRWLWGRSGFQGTRRTEARETTPSGAELDFARQVYRINQTAEHSRSLGTEYGYNSILNTDLVRQCLEILDCRRDVVRVLDIGCGDGSALYELENALAREGVAQHFKFYGMGSNWYSRMRISPKNFLLTAP